MNLRKIAKRTLKTLKYLLLGLLLMLVIIVGILQIPAVQTYMAQKGTAWLTEKSGYDIFLDKVKISWLDEVKLEGVHIYDLKKREMVHVSSIHVDYDLYQLYKTKELRIDHVSLDDPAFNVGWYEGDKMLSFSQFVKDVRGLFVVKSKKKNKKIKPFHITSGRINNGTFAYFNERSKKSELKNYFDHNHFKIDSINGDVKEFKILLDSISFEGININGNHSNSHIKIKDLDTKFLYCNKSIILDDLYAEIGESVIKDSLGFNYSSPNDFADFNRRVNIGLKLDESVITSKDLEVFAPSVSIFNDVLTLSGEANGRIASFSLNDMDLKFGKGSFLKGDISFSGLPKMSETFLDLKFSDAKVTPFDLKQYVRSKAFNEKAMSKFGTTKFSGNFRGFINNFVSHGDFMTQLGKISTDVNFVINSEDHSKTTYSGVLKTQGFNIGKFLEIDNLGEVDLKANIKPGSRGFTLNDGFVKLDGRISRLVYNDYPYKEIKVDAGLSDRRFVGDLSINDKNLILSTQDGFLDAKEQDFNVLINVEHIDFEELGFAKDSSKFEGIIDLKMKGLDVENPDIDNIQGYASFDQTKLNYGGRVFDLDGVKLLADKKEVLRNLSIESKYLDASLKGDYSYKKISRDFPELVKEYKLYFLNDQFKLDEHYNSKDTLFESYSVVLDAHLKEFEPLLAVLDSNYSISNDTKIKAELKRGVSNVFNFYSAPKYLRYKSYEFKGNEIDVSTSKLVNSPNSLGSVFIKSDNQTIDSVDYFDGTDLLVNINDDEVNFSFKTNQYNSDNYAIFKGDAEFNKDSLVVSLKDSYFHLLRKDWRINDDNLITATPGRIKFDGIEFVNTYQLLSLDGVLSAKPDDKLKVKLRDFDLENLQPYTTLDIAGFSSGNLEVSNALKSPVVESKILLKDLKVNNEVLGKLRGTWDWKEEDKKHLADFIFIRDEKEVAYVKGVYDVNNAVSPLDFKLQMKDTDFNLLEPFMGGVISNLKGKGNGEVFLTGTIEEPSWDGKLNIVNGGFLYDYFNTYYEFSQEVVFKEESFYMKNMVLKDTIWNTKGVLNGSLSHHWFKDYSSDLLVSLDRTFLLNTTAKNNALYYGTAFGSGDVLIYGLFSDLQISSEELTTNKGTKIVIPLEEPGNVSKKDYISFVTEEDKLNITKTFSDKDLSVSGVSMDINFNITDDAQFKIVFDDAAGDEIVGSGNGLINLTLSTLGDFNMYGTYEFLKGSYNFTFIDLIRKKFDIENEGKITWNGDPYQGELDINAIYKQYASLNTFVNDTSANANPDLDRKVPILINLGLTGDLLNPDVEFDINVDDYPPSLEGVVADFENRMRNNDQLKNKEVFSLIVLKQLAPEESLGSLGTSTSQNLSELFSNQFSSWISEFDENLDVDIELSGFDSESNNIFTVKLAYSLLDGRIRVSRDGSFQAVESSNDLANVFGEWTIEYLITEDGKIRMKAYNKNSSTTTLGTGDTSTNTTYGFSLTHNKSFDSLKDLFKRNPNKSEVDKD